MGWILKIYKTYSIDTFLVYEILIKNMSYLKRQKKKELEKFEGIESGGEWELYKTKVDGPGISQPEDAFVVVDAYYNKNCVFEVRKSASGPPQKTDPPTK